jgi:hypothetical protein
MAFGFTSPESRPGLYPTPPPSYRTASKGSCVVNEDSATRNESLADSPSPISTTRPSPPIDSASANQPSCPYGGLNTPGSSPSLSRRVARPRAEVREACAVESDPFTQTSTDTNAVRSCQYIKLRYLSNSARTMRCKHLSSTKCPIPKSMPLSLGQKRVLG